MTLYEDIGGAATVRAVLDVFYSRVLADPTLGPFFLGTDIDRLKHAQERFFQQALGGAETYCGRSVADAHVKTRRRGANGDVFDRYVTVFKGVLVDLRVPPRQIVEWLSLLEDARGQVLGR